MVRSTLKIVVGHAPSLKMIVYWLTAICFVLAASYITTTSWEFELITNPNEISHMINRHCVSIKVVAFYEYLSVALD